MATYSGNVLRMGAPADPRIAPGGPDVSHDQPSGPDQVPAYRAEEITVPADTGAEYAGLTMDDGIPRAIVAGQPGLGWNAPNTASTPVGSGGTPAGSVPAWTAGDPHNAQVDTSFASARYGALPGSPYAARTNPVHATGDDTLPYRLANQIGVAGSSFLERLAEFPRQIWAEPAGQGVDKFIAGTNSYGANNPEGDQYADGRGGARVHFGFESPYFVHQAMFIDKPAQFYERRTAPITARDPLVGGAYSNTPVLGQLAANPWLTELGESVVPSGYGVPVDGVL
jgi:hypothetical protein